MLIAAIVSDCTIANSPERICSQDCPNLRRSSWRTENLSEGTLKCLAWDVIKQKWQCMHVKILQRKLRNIVFVIVWANLPARMWSSEQGKFFNWSDMISRARTDKRQNDDYVVQSNELEHEHLSILVLNNLSWTWSWLGSWYFINFQLPLGLLSTS